MTRDEVFKVLVSNIKAVLIDPPEEAITEAASLVNDFGADSLQVVEIVSRTMRTAQVRVKRTELNKARNIGELLDMLTSTVAADTRTATSAS